jgi:hypothetical protein
MANVVFSFKKASFSQKFIFRIILKLFIIKFVKIAFVAFLCFIGLLKINRWEHMTSDWWQHNTLENNLNVDYNFLIPALKEFKNTPGSGICGGLESIINSSQRGYSIKVLDSN